MKDLKQRILDYNFEEDELDEIGEMTSAEELFTVLNQLLESDETEAVNMTLGFIRDFMTMNLSPEREAICDRYPDSSLVKAIEQLLFRPNHFMRRAAVYTLGKTCSYSSVDTLTRAFYQFRDSDPILLPRLLGELGWLGGEALDECVISMAESSVYMTRWASIPMLSQFGDLYNDEMYQRKSKRFQQFRNDENILIRQEAEYAYQEQRLSREMWVKDKMLRREQRKIVRQGKRGNRMKQLHQCRKNLSDQRWQGFAKEYEPEIYFDTVANSFSNRLWLKQADYTIVEFEAFIPQYVAFREQLQQTQKDNHTFEELDIFIASYAEKPLI
jgi:hypothetical protein